MSRRHARFLRTFLLTPAAIAFITCGSATAPGIASTRDGIPKSVYKLTGYEHDLQKLDARSRDHLARSVRDARDLAASYASLEHDVEGTAPTSGTSDELALWRLFEQEVHLRDLVASTVASHLESGNTNYAAQVAAFNEQVLRANWEFNKILAHYRNQPPPPRDTTCDGAGFALLLSRAHDDLHRIDAELQSEQTHALARKDGTAYLAAAETALPKYDSLLARLRGYSREASRISTSLRGGWEISQQLVSVGATGERNILSAFRSGNQNRFAKAYTAASNAVNRVDAQWATFANALNKQLAPCSN
jgi:hypothetical protein